MGRIRTAIAAACVGAAIAAPGAGAQTTTPDPPPTTTTTPLDPPTTTQPHAPNAGLVPAAPAPAPRPKPKPQPKPKPKPKPPTGGTRPGKPKAGVDQEQGAQDGTAPAPVTPLPSSCGPVSVPSFLIPIYGAASQEYELGPSGPSILAAINEIESGFGQNLGPSSAGAEGWMQFMPSTWAGYGVDANGDGVRDPNNPNDAIYAAARYLRAAGMPEDPEGAVFAYNHADWYVAEVLARAACFSGIGSGVVGGLSLIPKQQVLVCDTAKDARESIPERYMKAFQDAAGHYELGESGVWALAAVARLESAFGKGMSARQLRETGPLGISDENWKRYAVDGDADGKIRRETPADSAATLARMIWAADDLRAGLFQHNHAEWYVKAVLNDAESMAGSCQVKTVAYSVALPGPTNAPINWSNVELSNSLEMVDIQSGAIDSRILNLLGAISQQHTVRISALRSDHSRNTASGNVSNHYYGRAMDIAAIDGVPCTDVSPDGPCGTIARQLGALSAGQEPTELIYCFDPDGPANPNGFAQADHCDHIHVGFDA
ncbi:MAG TPA: lytic murein transglycosylase [Solirubrobacterales bacterium]|nr:lytic murein transglycosylase [Solirubrobacterales bacterium]